MDGSTFLASLAAAQGATSPTSPLAGAAAPMAAKPPASAVIQFGALLDSFPVSGSKNVTLIPSEEDADPSASKVSIRNIVNFGWEHGFYPGQVVASSPGGKFMAYGIVTPGKSEGVVRVVHRNTEERTLLKGMKGRVRDVAFAHTRQRTILGCVDEFGNLFVFSVGENAAAEGSGTLSQELLLEVTADPSDPATDYHRVIWCPYLPEDEEEDEEEEDSPARQLVVTRGCTAEVWNIDMVLSSLGKKVSRAEHRGHNDISGRLIIAGHDKAITDAAFSPDGTAIATASLDGKVKFFQCYLAGASESSPPRCLHQWSPHGGRPVSSLFFLDDHKVHNPDVQFWKFAVTGADFNSELKVWSCESWTCLQTIKLSPPATAGGQQPRSAFKAAIDLAAKYLVLSDIHRKYVYVLHLSQRDKNVGVISVSEFATPSAFLSMSVVSAGLEKVKDEHLNYEDRPGNRSEDELDIIEMEELMESNNSRKSKAAGGKKEATVVEIIIVQPKSLQHCRIVYDDAAGINVKKEPEAVFEEQTLSPAGITDSLSKVKLEPMVPKIEMTTPPERPNLSRGDSERSDLEAAAKTITLMSPDAFSAPIPKKSPAATAATPNGKTNLGKSITPVKVKTEPMVKDEILDDDSIQLAPADVVPVSSSSNGLSTSKQEERSARVIPRSGQSSPSREVQDILCETEEIGGLGAEVIITEEDDFDDVEDEDDDEDDADDSDDEDEGDDDDEEFDDALNKTDPLSLACGPQPPDASTLSNPADWPSFGKTIKQEPVDEDEVEVVRGAAAAAVTSPAAAAISSADLAVLLRKFDELREQVTAQRAEMQLLREEVMEGRRSDRQKVEQLIRQSGQSTSNTIKQERKNIADAVAGSLGKSVSSRVEAAMGAEMKRASSALVQSTSASVSQALERDLHARVGKSEAQLRDAISKSVQSKSVADAIGQAVAASLQASMQSGFRDALNNTLIPAFERAVQNMFVQLSTTFARGVKEHETLVKKTADPLLKELRALAAETRPSKQNELVASIRESVATEVSQALDRHSRSLSATPLDGSMVGAASPSSGGGGQPTFIEMQNMVRAHLKRGDFDGAFQMALSANNLPLVVSTCEMINPTQVFNPPCSLTQNVLLALIQQLGHNLDEHTELKHRFLEESVLNLDSANPSTRVHMKAILGGLQEQLQAFSLAHANDKMAKQTKMLLMATRSLLTTD